MWLSSREPACMHLHFMDMPHFVHPFITDEHLDRFHFGAVTNSAAMNTHGQVSVPTHVVGYTPRSRCWLDHTATLRLTSCGLSFEDERTLPMKTLLGDSGRQRGFTERERRSREHWAGKN